MPLVIYNFEQADKTKKMQKSKSKHREPSFYSQLQQEQFSFIWKYNVGNHLFGVHAFNFLGIPKIQK